MFVFNEGSSTSLPVSPAFTAMVRQIGRRNDAIALAHELSFRSGGVFSSNECLEHIAKTEEKNSYGRKFLGKLAKTEMAAGLSNYFQETLPGRAYDLDADEVTTYYDPLDPSADSRRLRVITTEAGKNASKIYDHAVEVLGGLEGFEHTNYIAPRTVFRTTTQQPRLPNGQVFFLLQEHLTCKFLRLDPKRAGERQAAKALRNAGFHVEPRPRSNNDDVWVFGDSSNSRYMLIWSAWGWPRPTHIEKMDAVVKLSILGFSGTGLTSTGEGTYPLKEAVARALDVTP
jgi:hypothetical protein